MTGITMVLPGDGASRRTTGTLVERTAGSLCILPDEAPQPDQPALVAPGQAVIVVVHGDVGELVLAAGVAREGADEHVVLRIVERRG